MLGTDSGTGKIIPAAPESRKLADVTTDSQHGRQIGEAPQADETAPFTAAYYFLPHERPLSIDDKAIIWAGGTPPIRSRLTTCCTKLSCLLRVVAQKSSRS